MQESGDDLEKHDGNSPGIMDGARIISYNLNEDERPGGIKIRIKIRIETGKKARVIDARQAEVIKEYLRWVRQYRNSGHADTSPAPGQGR
jgi:hypothetical protein